MAIKKWIPWNWFKKEEEVTGKSVPVRRPRAQEQSYATSNPIDQLHYEVDRLFDQAFRGFGLTSLGLDRRTTPRMAGGMLKPTLDLGATDKEYTISIEVPGADEKDIRVEIVNDTLIICGEKKQEKEEKEKNYYRMERSYGAFQRMLSLPEDADQEKVTANFKNGVLTVTMDKLAAPQANVRQIEVKSA